MSAIDPQSLLATDTRSLDNLRRQAGSDPRSAARAAAGQFEAVFMKQVLKAMRDAVPRSGMWESPAQNTYSDMLDQQLTQSLAGRPGGLADIIARQLTRQLGGTDTPAAAQATGQATLGTEIPFLAQAVADAGSRAQISASQAQDPAPMPPLQTRGHRAAPEAVIRQALAAFNAQSAEPTSAPQAIAATPARWTEASGAARSSAQPDLSRLNPRQADFVRKVWPHALVAERSTGVPAAFIVGQAALESGWGRHEIRHPDGSASFNLFGIKAGGSWQGGSVAARTTEFVEGQATRRVENFRAYGSYAEAFQDWANLMANNPRYSRVLQSGGSVQTFAANMQRAGYATDPSYGSKLEKVIQTTLGLQRLLT